MFLKSLRNYISTGLILSLMLCTTPIFSSAAPPETHQPVELENLGITPSFITTSIDNERIDLSDYNGKIIFINFWATWCGPCRREIPDFIKLQNEYKDDLAIVGISLDDTVDPVLEYTNRTGVNYPVTMTNSTISSIFGSIQGIPTTFIIDRTFTVRKKIVGIRSYDEFKEIIETLK